MKKIMLKLVAVMLTFVILSLPSFSNINAVETQKSAEIDKIKIVETRLLNMLNHSQVYGEDFETVESIVNNSVTALVLNGSENDGSYISEDVVNNYLFDMYGFSVDDFSSVNSDFPKKDGYIYIVPKGYALYEHTALDLTANDDGTLTLITSVKIKTHDRVDSVLECKTLFVENEASAFGFNIVTTDFTNSEIPM